MKLSILICITPDRLRFAPELLRAFDSQLPELSKTEYEARDGYELFRFTYGSDVELLFCMDNKITSIGAKRNILVENSYGDYVAHFDSDDLPSDCYIEENMKGIEKGVDCNSLVGEITTDGANPKVFRHYLDCEKYDEINGEYVRFENHLNCIKRSIAIQIKFPEKNFSEDTDWAIALHNSGLLKTEHKIEKTIYHYRYISNKK